MYVDVYQANAENCVLNLGEELIKSWISGENKTNIPELTIWSL